MSHTDALPVVREPEAVTQRGVSRRRLVAGAAWTAPALAMAAPASALAASTCVGTPVTTTFSFTGAVQTLSIPANAMKCPYISFTVIGGNGGVGTSAVRGRGQVVTGTLTRASTTTALALRVFVGGGGANASNSTAIAGPWGYGRGGGCQAVPAGAGAHRGCAGGGGSAIVFGTSTPLVVAGGGGGSGNGYISAQSTACSYAGTVTGIIGSGGNAASDGGRAFVRLNNPTICNSGPGSSAAWADPIPGGLVGSGTTGGQPGAAPTINDCYTTVPDGTTFTSAVGTVGGNLVAAAGADGGTGGCPATNASPTGNPVTRAIPSGGGGGGGYAGGGAGGTGGYWIPDLTWCQVGAGISAGGAGGTNFWGNATGITTAAELAGLSTLQTPGVLNGADGQVTITYWT